MTKSIFYLLTFILTGTIHTICADTAENTASVSSAVTSTFSRTSTNTHPFITSARNAQQPTQNVFNVIASPEYYQFQLPQDFSFLTQLISCSNKTPQACTQGVLTLQLFSKLIKGSNWVHPQALQDFLKDSTPLFQALVCKPRTGSAATASLLANLDTWDRMHALVNPLVLGRFSTQYEQFKVSPTQFLDRLTNDIVALALDEMQRGQVRQMLIRFLEQCLGKLVWNPENHAHIWTSVKELGNQLHNLQKTGILDDENDVDDLYWSLIHRFIYIVDAVAADLPEEFYTTVMQDIPTSTCCLLTLEEQEPFLESKSNCLMRNLRLSLAKRQAYQNGIYLS